MKYRCKKDIVLFEHTLAEKNELVEVGQVLKNGPLSVTIDDEFIANPELFEPFIENLQIKTKEFSTEVEDIEKEWIIEIKIKTTRKNLRKIEEFLNKEITNFL